MIKSDYFFFPLGIILKCLGGIPVTSANKKKRTIPHIIKLFNKHDTFHLLITPEGTRKKRVKWKRGFYEIAMSANVPIHIGKLDYGKKEGTTGVLFTPTGNYKEDIKYIQSHYKNVTARHPNQFAKEY